MNLFNFIKKEHAFFWIIVLTGSASPASFAQWNFDLSGLGDSVDKDNVALLNEGAQLPGKYLVDIIFNQQLVETREVQFSPASDKSGVLKACIYLSQLEKYGVNTEQYPDLTAPEHPEQCVRLSAIPDATERFSMNTLQLQISVPQVALKVKTSGIAPPELWDDGVPAFLMNYRINANRTDIQGQNGHTSSFFFSQLQPGFNLGAWRVRNMTSFSKRRNEKVRSESAYTYAERGISYLKSRLTLGDRYTYNTIFDSLPFRGLLLTSDENMVPYNQRQYAPVISGIARTQARIDVKKDDYLLYSTVVSPGHFELTDLPLSGQSGTLNVSVTESDGTVKYFSVPVSTPAISLRQGYIKYGFMAGRYRPADESVKSQPVSEAYVMAGLPYGVTTYSGIQLSRFYTSASLGVGVSLGQLGALSVDGTGSQGKRSGQRSESGQAWRVRYSKILESTGSGLTVTNFKYASPGFNTLQGVLDTYQSRNNELIHYSESAKKTQSLTSVLVSQSLGDAGSLSLSGSRETYWHSDSKTDQITASYSSSVWNISWMASFSRNYRRDGFSRLGRMRDAHENLFSLWVSIPLDRWYGRNLHAYYQLQKGGDDRMENAIGLGGSGFDKRLNWDVRTGRSQGGLQSATENGYANLSWSGTYGEAGAGYSYGEQYREMSARLAGGIVAHAEGITLGQRLGNTVALIKATGASGIHVSGWPGVNTDYRGYTTLGYLTPYQTNTVSLDPNTASDAELARTDKKVTPTAGAVVLADFHPQIGSRAIIRLTRPGNLTVPYGALAKKIEQSTSEAPINIVDENSLLYISGLPKQGLLKISWHHNSCYVKYSLLKARKQSGIYRIDGVCR